MRAIRSSTRATSSAGTPCPDSRNAPHCSAACATRATASGARMSTTGTASGPGAQPSTTGWSCSPGHACDSGTCRAARKSK
uniref:Uncharacterized protein n=1 Tax=Arundo donax TaxID=35708 RepID=A0A0A9DLP9_ARUDO